MFATLLAPRHRRLSLAVAVLAGVLLSPGAALAATEKARFEYGVDRVSWYWNKQLDEEAGGEPLPVSQRVRVRNPQNPDTLPVSVEQGKLERISAIFFDLSGRGVIAGSSIQKAVLTLTESSDGNEQPAFNSQGKAIQACRIDDYWPGGEAEKWDTAPPYDETTCVEGKRREAKPGEKEIRPPTWTFDLTQLAQPWGQDPVTNNGVMLVGALPENPGPTDTWQINLKIPARDRDVTPMDEYKETRDRALLSLAFTPGSGSALAPGGGVTLDSGSSFAPSTDLGAGSADLAEPEPPAPAAKPKPAQPATTPAGSFRPKAPWFVWFLVPAGLLALSAVRSAVLEPAGGPRPDGVIAAIRRLNAERHGRPLAEATSGPSPLRRALAAAGAPFLAVGRAGSRAGRALRRAGSALTRRPG